MFLKVRRLDDENVAFPSTYGMTIWEGLRCRRVFTPIQPNRSFGVHPVDFHYDAIPLDGDRIGNRIKHQSGSSNGDAILLRRGLWIDDRHCGLALLRDGPISRRTEE